MRNGKNNEMFFILSILKSPEIEYNSNNLAKVIGISAMGALKIARKLEKENLISLRKIGKAKVFRVKIDNEYARQYIRFLLRREAEKAPPYVKRWIRELEKIKDALGILLFGSVLKKEKEAKDIDVLLIVNKKNFDKVKVEVENINLLNEKKIHPLYQTKEDLERHIKEGNKIILNAIKGIIVSGVDIIIEALQK